MMEVLRFSTVLKEIPVYLTGKDNVEKNFILKELTGKQRATYNESFDVKIEMDETGKAKATAGEGFKTFSAKHFLALCLYDDKGLVDEKILGEYPSSMLGTLHTAAMKLSGLDKESLEAAKNELGGNDSSGTE